MRSTEESIEKGDATYVERPDVILIIGLSEHGQANPRAMGDNRAR